MNFAINESDTIKNFQPLDIYWPENKQEWLKLKAQDISSTEVSALFNMSPYLTKFELYHIKKDGQIVEIEDNDRMKWGRRLEDVIAQGFAEDNGLFIRKKDEYMRHGTCRRMGASFDYEIIGLKESAISLHNEYQKAFLNNGNGLLEIKKVDYLIYRDQWDKEEAPAHIEFQVQQQMEVSDLNWTVICPLVAGNELKDFIRLRDREMGKGLVDAIHAFWSLPEAPEADYSKDAEFIINLYGKAGQDVYMPTGAALTLLEQMCAQYKEAAAAEANAADLKQILKAQIVEMAGNEVGSAITPNWKINLGEVKGSVGTVISAEMVGTITGARKGYRQCRISENKGKK